MTIYLVRHGLALAGSEDLDPGLAPMGHEQAEAAARALQNVRARRLVVSPLRRTRETAIPIARVLGLEPQFREEVAEVFDPAMPPEERRQMIGPFMAGKWGDQPAHLQAWRRRAVEAVLELALEAESHSLDLVVVSHYIAIGAVIGEAAGDSRVVPQPMANASITSLTLVHGGLVLAAAAKTDHLAPEMVTGLHSAMAGRG
jgi:broad specificity phosphatase PhoE